MEFCVRHDDVMELQLGTGNWKIKFSDGKSTVSKQFRRRGELAARWDVVENQHIYRCQN